MAERRMFAKTIIDSDAFLDMPLTTQALYFHLSMRGDDEGFINNPKKIQRMIGATEDDLRLLIAKNFIIPFESGVVVIKHWKIHNYIRSDRLVATKYQDEKELLSVKENGSYTISNDLKLLDEISNNDKRKHAYENSSLPYSFSYKIRRAFEECICPLCNCKMSSSNKITMPTVQHNIPLSKGGEHELHNISVICGSCNSSIRDNEIDSLNNLEVIRKWDRIVYAERHNINWFDNPLVLENISDSQLTDMCQSDGSIGKVRLGKDSLGKDRLGEDSKGECIPVAEATDTPVKEKKHKYGEYKHVLLTDNDRQRLVNDYGEEATHDAIKFLDEYIETSGKRYKNHYLVMRKWVFDAVKERRSKIESNTENSFIAKWMNA